MVKLRKWAKRAVFVGLTGFIVLFASVYLGGGAAGSPLPAATLPSMGSAASFAVLGGSTVTNTGATTVTGDLGVSPGSAVTGFPPGIVTGGTIHAADAAALQAQNDVITGYNNLAGQTCDVDLTGQDLGGKTLTPGVYCFSSSAGLTGALTLNAQGNGSAVWVFKIGSTLTTASSSSVSVINGGTICNVFWQVGSSATLGTATTFVGSILALTSITLTTGASLSGRALARNGAVTLDTNTISASGCAAATATPTSSPLPATATSTLTPLPATATAIAATATAIAAATPTATPLPATATAIAATATAIAAATPTATPLPATATAIAATATAIAAATPTATPPTAAAPAPVCGTGRVDLTKRLEDQNGNDIGVAENLPQLELVLGGNHIRAEVIGVGKVRFSGLGAGEWEIWENSEPTGKTSNVGCDTATEAVLFNRIEINVTATPAAVAAAATPAATPAATAAATPAATAAATPAATAAATPAAAPVPAVLAASAATPVPSTPPLPNETPKPAPTPTAVAPMTLPFTGDPYGIGLVWLALIGGAGAFILGSVLRRDS